MSFEDISMFGSNFEFQPTHSQSQLESFAEYPYAANSTTAAAGCQHRDLQEILDSGDPSKAMTNTSKGLKLLSQVLQMPPAASTGGDVDKLRNDCDEMRKRVETQDRSVGRLNDMITSLVGTIAKQGIAMKEMIEEMSPDARDIFLRRFKQELLKLPTKSA